MNLKQTLLIAALENNGGNTVFIPFPANEKKEGDKSKLEKLLLSSQGLIRIFLISFCLFLFSFQGLHSRSYTLNNTLNGSTQTTCSGTLLENNGFEAGNMNYWTVNTLSYYDFYTGNDNCGTKSVRLKKLVGLGLITPFISQQKNNIEASQSFLRLLKRFQCPTHLRDGFTLLSSKNNTTYKI